MNQEDGVVLFTKENDVKSYV